MSVSSVGESQPYGKYTPATEQLAALGDPWKGAREKQQTQAKEKIEKQRTRAREVLQRKQAYAAIDCSKQGDILKKCCPIRWTVVYILILCLGFAVPYTIITAGSPDLFVKDKSLKKADVSWSMIISGLCGASVACTAAAIHIFMNNKVGCNQKRENAYKTALSKFQAALPKEGEPKSPPGKPGTLIGRLVVPLVVFGAVFGTIFGVLKGTNPEFFRYKADRFASKGDQNLGLVLLFSSLVAYLVTMLYYMIAFKVCWA